MATRSARAGPAGPAPAYMPLQRTGMLGELGRTISRSDSLLAECPASAARLSLFADFRQRRWRSESRSSSRCRSCSAFSWTLVSSRGVPRPRGCGPNSASTSSSRSGDELCRFAFGFLPCAIELGPLHGQYGLLGFQFPRAGSASWPERRAPPCGDRVARLRREAAPARRWPG